MFRFDLGQSVSPICLNSLYSAFGDLGLIISFRPKIFCCTDLENCVKVLSFKFKLLTSLHNYRNKYNSLATLYFYSRLLLLLQLICFKQHYIHDHRFYYFSLAHITEDNREPALLYQRLSIASNASTLHYITLRRRLAIPDKRHSYF